MEEGDRACPISGDEFRELIDGKADHPVRLTSCGHLFGDNSILQWLENNSTCPVCRSEILQVFGNRCAFKQRIYNEDVEENGLTPQRLAGLVEMLSRESRDLPPSFPLFEYTEYIQKIDSESFAEALIV